MRGKAARPRSPAKSPGIGGGGGTYISLDDEGLREGVLADPVTFLANQRYPLVIDEAQRGGDRIVFAVKRLVDEARTPGRFLLTGSTNFLTVPNISESLAGRIQIFRLGPLCEAELAGTQPTEIDRWFDGNPSPASASDIGRADYFAIARRGAIPRSSTLIRPNGGTGSRTMSKRSSSVTSSRSQTTVTLRATRQGSSRLSSWLLPTPAP